MVIKRKRQVSIRDVAKASGVSLTTVSLILNKSDQRISDATRQRVLKAIDDLGYQPNRLAQGLQSRKSNILAILVPQLRHTFADVYFGELISGIYDVADDAGYKILLEAAGEEFVGTKRYLERFDRCFIDGMLFMGSNDEHEFVADLVGPDRPLMLVDNPRDKHFSVVCDYQTAGRLAAEHLLDLGHREIGFIHGAMDVQTARLVRDGFVEALKAAKIRLPEKRMADGLFTEQGGADAVSVLMKREPSLTAIFAGNDKMAIGALQRLLLDRKAIPNEVSIIGCDDIHQASYTTPALSTVRTPVYDVGRLACQRLIDILNGRRETCEEVLPVELVVRQSTSQRTPEKV